MPRWASRITLRVTGVRAERLRDISDADCIAEGIEPGTADPKAAYMALWDSINGAGASERNPWVYILDFEKDASK